MAKKSKETLKAMDKADARVVIARDVIHQLRYNRLVARQGVYVQPWMDGSRQQNDLFTPKDVDNGKDVKDVLFKRAEYCEVCAKGALFISAIMKFDNFPVNDLLVEDAGHIGVCASHGTALDAYFDESQLELIEYTFEKGNAGTCYSHEEHKKAIHFYEQYDDTHDLLVAIMKNIIKNKGTFILPEVPVSAEGSC
jgi:hypothetical protein